MFRFAAIIVLAGLACAQEPAENPPAEVDQALRARMQEFYHYFETKEYRKAEKLIAEDSQDFFYDHNKPHYLSTSIQSIKYFDHFTRATAVILCEQYIMMPGFAGKPMKVPTTSTWKVVDGQWFWYVDPIESRRTPFGVITERPNNAPTQPAALPPIPTTADFALNLVKVESNAIELKPDSSMQVTFTNTARGMMNVSVVDLPQGVAAEFNRQQLNIGDKSLLTVKAGKNARSGKIAVKVMPTSETIVITLTVKQP
jgi:hypothetical protein